MEIQSKNCIDCVFELDPMVTGANMLESAGCLRSNYSFSDTHSTACWSSRARPTLTGQQLEERIEEDSELRKAIELSSLEEELNLQRQQQEIESHGMHVQHFFTASNIKSRNSN